jgi:hypothetical protein
MKDEQRDLVCYCTLQFTVGGLAFLAFSRSVFCQKYGKGKVCGISAMDPGGQKPEAFHTGPLQQTSISCSTYCKSFVKPLN